MLLSLIPAIIEMQYNIAKKNEPSKLTQISSRTRLAQTPTKLIREASPTSINRILTGRVTNLSPSPMRKPADAVENEELLIKEFQYHKAQEKKYAEKISLLKQENLSLKKIMLKNENDIKLKTAKIENESDRIVELLTEMIGKKQVTLKVDSDIGYPNDRGLERSNPPSPRSLTPSNAFKDEKPIKVNIAMKEAIQKSCGVVSGPLRALGRVRQIS